MPQITGVAAQKHDPSFCNIHIDGKFALVLSAMDVADLGLKSGMVIAPEDVARLEERAGNTKAFRMALRFITVRPRSRYEISQYLRRKGVDSEMIEPALNRLQQSGLQNDREFAQMWVRDRLAFRSRSRRQLEQELSQKGIERSISEEILREIPASDNREALQRVIEKKRRLGYDDTKLKQYLARQGYTYDDVKRALSDDEE